MGWKADGSLMGYLFPLCYAKLRAICKTLGHTRNNAPLPTSRYKMGGVDGSPLGCFFPFCCGKQRVDCKALERMHYLAPTPTPPRRTRGVLRMKYPFYFRCDKTWPNFSHLISSPLPALQEEILLVMTICGVK